MCIRDSYINDVKVHHLWNAPKYKDSVRRMSAMTLGLIGFGNIARMLAKRMPVSYTHLLSCVARHTP